MKVDRPVLLLTITGFGDMVSNKVDCNALNSHIVGTPYVLIYTGKSTEPTLPESVPEETLTT